MPENRWTDEQRSVIDLRACSLIVSAAAGSGKTAVLVERIISMVSCDVNPINIDELLVVTFTNAAAAEMKERVAAALEKKLLEKPESEHLKRQQLLIHNANIMTIHSFCLRIIRNYFQIINLDPSFRIAEEEELALVKSDVMAELFEENYVAGNGDFLELVECYGSSKSDKAVEKLILGLYTFAAGYPWQEEWLESTLDDYGIAGAGEMENSRWMMFLKSYCHNMFESAAAVNDEMAGLVKENPQLSFYEGMISGDFDIICALRAADTYAQIYAAISAVEFMRMPSRKITAENTETQERLGEIREQIKQMRGKVKDIVLSVREKFFYQNPEEMAQDIAKTADPMKSLVRLTIDFGRKFSARKEKLNLIDFNDIEHFALRILLDGTGGNAVPSQPALELRESFAEIMVDEYQDSNYVQECIINAIAGDGMCRPYIFTVGDVKQSIYKFRLARPSLFLDRCELYEDGRRGKRINLHKNFRSRIEVIDSVNSVFRMIMHSIVGDVEYDDSAALHAGADYPESKGTKSEFRIIDVSTMDESGSDSVRRIEALDVARRIRELTGGNGMQVFDRGSNGMRGCEYGDIVILLRTMSGWAEEFASVLMEYDIPVYCDVQTGFFGTTEIQTMINYLRILDNPLQDIPLAAVLHSPVVGLGSDEMAQIRIYGSEGVSFFEAACAYSEGGENRELRDKLSNFLSDFNKLRELQRSSELEELIFAVYERTGYYDYVTAMKSGDRRRANLDMLAQKASSFERTSYHGLFGFIRYIEKLERYEIDYGEASTGKDGNAVRIMSIHKSKGLEFPVVILAGVGKQFNKADAQTKVVLHPDYGMGPDCVDLRLRTKIPTLTKRVMSQAIVNESIGEELRVLYVAMTRAREKLIISGTVKNLDKLKTLSSGESDYYDITTASCFMDLIRSSVDEKYFEICYTNAYEVVSDERQYLGELASRSFRVIREESDEGTIEVLRRLRDGSYPHEALRNIPVKVSVSELKGVWEEEEIPVIMPDERYDGTVNQETIVPSFMRRDRAAVGSELGSLYHRVMQLIPLNLRSSVEAEGFLGILGERGIVEANEVRQLSIPRLVAFLNTELADRMRLADERGELYRERAFVISVPANRISSAYGSGEGILVQGIVDAYFIEEGMIVLLDYKTDRVSSGEVLADRYRVQMDYYAEALERLTNLRVRERLIYSFQMGEVIRLSD